MLSTRRITSLALPWRNRIRPVTVASGVLCKYAVASAVLCVRGVVSGHMQFSGYISLLFYCVARFHAWVPPPEQATRVQAAARASLRAGLDWSVARLPSSRRGCSAL